MTDVTIGAPVSVEKEKPRPPTLNLNFPKDSTVQPSGFECCALKKRVRVIVEGEVKNVEDTTREYDWGGKNLGLYLESCKVEECAESGDDEKKEPAGLSEVLEKVKSYVAGK